MMHEREKSDPAIGAGKPTNNAEATSVADAAEPVEQRAGAETHEPPQPHPVPVLALKGAVSPLGIGRGRSAGALVRSRCSPMRIGAQGNEGCSRQIGSAREGNSVRAVARGSTRRFATLHSVCYRATTFLEPRGKGTEGMASPDPR